MSVTDILMIVPNQPGLSALAWFILGSLLLYFARTPAHATILAFSRVIHHAMRLAAFAVVKSAAKLRARNREVLIEMGREASERLIEREFHRVEAVIKRDLDAYPLLHRKLSERVEEIDKDYRSALEQPPEPPGWVNAVKEFAKIPMNRDPNVVDILEDMQKSLERSKDEALDEYRKTSLERHEILKKMMPKWRATSQILEKVGNAVRDVNTRSQSIDKHLKSYQEMNTHQARAERTLSSSAVAQFFVSFFVLAIAFGGALVNFKLIAYPMQELMTEGRSYVGAFKTGDISALVIILFEIVMGVLLLETLRITRLFPEIGALNDRHRIPMIWAFFTLLLFFACIEASLAYMRDYLELEAAKTKQTLADAKIVIEPGFRWLGTAGQMALGFVLPFALACIAIPLESFVKSIRTVGGYAAVAGLFVIAFILRLIGNIARFGGTMLIHIYDLLVFGPLWIERTITGKKYKSPTLPGIKAKSKP